jgi:hypothetical protein
VQRSCNPISGVGCPGDDYDADGDGVPDGGYTCRGRGSEGYCWPKTPPAPPEPAPPNPPGKKGRAGLFCAGAAPDAFLTTLLAFLALRRSASRRRKSEETQR